MAVISTELAPHHMSPAIQQMHDATLISIRFDWISRICIFEFAGAPNIQRPFVLEFSGVTELVMSATEEWGPSNSVLDVSDDGAGLYQFTMQSGDIIRVVASGNSLGDFSSTSDP